MPAEYGAWNPGLESQLPREYLPLSTMFKNENVSTSIAKAHELSDYCGLPAHELVAFRPERLIVHELLIHVTTSLSVPDGRDYEDLGRNFGARAGYPREHVPGPEEMMHGPGAEQPKRQDLHEGYGPHGQVAVRRWQAVMQEGHDGRDRVRAGRTVPWIRSCSREQ